MTKEEIKTGIYIKECGERNYNQEVVSISTNEVCLRFGDRSGFEIIDISDLDNWQKVEPVKKYWKHVVEWTCNNNDKYKRVTVEIMNRQVSDFSNAVGEYGINLKEPTEITLEDI